MLFNNAIALNVSHPDIYPPYPKYQIDFTKEITDTKKIE